MLILLRQNTGAAASKQMRCLAKRLLATQASTPMSTAAPAEEHYDIIIGGGGMVGTTLAAALAKNETLAEKRVLLLEGAGEFKGFNPTGPYQNRVSAINRNSIELFKSIGVWEHIEKARYKPVKQMQVWESQSEALIQFQHDNFASDVACIIENDLILDAVYARLRESSPNVQVLNKSRIECVRLPGTTGESQSLSHVQLQDGRRFNCDLLIGADGVNSLIRKEMGVDVYSFNYNRMGLVATLDLETDCDNSVAWQRFLPNGPVALLPLSDKQSSLVWSTTVEQAKQLQGMQPAEFVDALNEAFCKVYPRLELADKALQSLNAFFGHTGTHRQYPPRVSSVQDGSRATFPLGFLHASSYVCHGAALVGDAAHRVHPLAGQGVNLGFGDVRHLVDTLAAGAYAGFKLGDTQHLIKYERKCLTKNVPIMIGVHGLHSLYSTEFSPVVMLRSLGLQLTQNLPPIKNLFMKSAMG